MASNELTVYQLMCMAAKYDPERQMWVDTPAVPCPGSVFFDRRRAETYMRFLNMRDLDRMVNYLSRLGGLAVLEFPCKITFYFVRSRPATVQEAEVLFSDVPAGGF